MDDKKIEIIYKMLINGIKLTNNTLSIYGFTQEEIEKLITKKIIEMQQDGIYKLYQVDKLRKYGVSLLLNGHYKEADLCFKISYELAPTGKMICLQAMLSALHKKNYKKIFEIYSNLEKIHPEKNSKDNLLYLYLLSIITEIPEEYREKARQIKPLEMMLPNKVGLKVENEIRKYIGQHKFTYAHQLICQRMVKEINYSTKFELIKKLCAEAIEQTKKMKEQLFHLIASNQYEQILELLLEQQNQRELSELELNILLISNAIVKISKTGTIPEKTIQSTNNMQKAILGNNFKLALDINEEFLEFNKIPKESNLINMLLNKINALILSIEEKQKIEAERICIEKKQQELQEVEDLTDFIRMQNIPIDLAIKKSGLLHEQVLLVKLILARDYYKVCNYEAGDKYLQAVEQSVNKTENVFILLDEIREIRNKYLEQNTSYTRCLIPKS